MGDICDSSASNEVAALQLLKQMERISLAPDVVSARPWNGRFRSWLDMTSTTRGFEVGCFWSFLGSRN